VFEQVLQEKEDETTLEKGLMLSVKDDHVLRGGPSVRDDTCHWALR